MEGGRFNRGGGRSSFFDSKRNYQGQSSNEDMTRYNLLDASIGAMNREGNCVHPNLEEGKANGGEKDEAQVERQVWREKVGQIEISGPAEGVGKSRDGQIDGGSGTGTGKMMGMDVAQHQQLLGALLSQLAQNMTAGGTGITMNPGAGDGKANSGRLGELEKTANGGELKLGGASNDGGRTGDLKRQLNKGAGHQNFGEEKKQSDKFGKQVCGKRKDPRHSTRECKIGHYLICGRDNHITGECNWLK